MNDVYLSEAETFKAYRKSAAKAAEELGYPASTVAAIWKAENTAQITIIMATARKKKFS